MREATWVVRFRQAGPEIDRVLALTAHVEDGALVLRDQDGIVLRAYAAGVWQRVSREEVPDGE